MARQKIVAEKAMAGAKEEGLIRSWLSTGESVGKDGDIIWAKGDTLYSYRTIIAKRDAPSDLLYVNEKKYSRTTSKHTKYLEQIASSSGWKIEQKPEEFFNTSMPEKLPGGYRDQVRDLVNQIARDEEISEMAKALAEKHKKEAAPEAKALLDWTKLAKMGIKKFASDDRDAPFNKNLLGLVASHLKDKFGKSVKMLTSSETQKLKLRLRTDQEASPADLKSDNIDKFMKDVWGKTQPHPFENKIRIFNNEAVIELRPWLGGPKGERSVALKWIQALEPRQGQGTRAMQFIVDLADKYGVILDLQPVPKEKNKMPISKLRTFYKKFGFTGHSRMVRLPKNGNQAVGGAEDDSDSDLKKFKTTLEIFLDKELHGEYSLKELGEGKMALELGDILADPHRVEKFADNLTDFFWRFKTKKTYPTLIPEWSDVDGNSLIITTKPEDSENQDMWTAKTENKVKSGAEEDWEGGELVEELTDFEAWLKENLTELESMYQQYKLDQDYSIEDRMDFDQFAEDVYEHGVLSATEESEEEESEEEEFQDDQPDDQDIIFSDSGPLGSKISVSIKNGEFLGEFNTAEEAEAAAKAWMQKHNFWPNVWYVSDHGNVSPYKMESAAKKAVKSAESDPFPNLAKEFDRIHIYDEDSAKIGKPWEVLISGDPTKAAEIKANKFFGTGNWKWVKDSSPFGKHIEDDKGNTMELTSKSSVQAAVRIEATGEADQDYDHETFDKICKELEKHGFECEHREFDKYQGTYIDVFKDSDKIDRLWVKDFFFSGPVKENPAVKYKSAVLIDENGDEVSSNRGDYFQLGDDEVMEGCQLILVDKAGNETIIEEPKVGDLPDLMEVQRGVEYAAKPDEVYIFWAESMGEDPEAGVPVVIEADGSVVADDLVEYLSSEKIEASSDEDEEEEEEEKTYKIVRFYKEGHPQKVMKKGLSLEEAKEWCNDDETSSKTCEKPENVKHTEEFGDWFDGFTAESSYKTQASASETAFALKIGFDKVSLDQIKKIEKALGVSGISFDDDSILKIPGKVDPNLAIETIKKIIGDIQISVVESSYYKTQASTTLEELKAAMAEAKKAYENGERYYDKKHNTYNPASYVENILEHVSDLVGYHGVEAYDPNESNPTRPRFQYINSGDTYNLTVVYDREKNKFLYTDIGSIIEKYDNQAEASAKDEELTVILDKKGEGKKEVKVKTYEEAMDLAEEHIDKGYHVGILFEDGTYEDV
jgi:hypothetical protein